MQLTERFDALKNAAVRFSNKARRDHICITAVGAYLGVQTDIAEAARAHPGKSAEQHARGRAARQDHGAALGAHAPEAAVVVPREQPHIGTAHDLGRQAHIFERHILHRSGVHAENAGVSCTVGFRDA